jgi:hypothetical protein
MQLSFSNPLFTWRGPSPFHFIAVPAAESERIRSAAALVSYGWGMIPVTAQIGETTWTTSLFAKDGVYVVPIKNAVRLREILTVGELVELTISLGI